MLLRSYEDSRAWQTAHEWTLAVYRESSNFPKAEIYGLTSQLRRAAVSVPANLAEGYGRHSKRELRRFCLIANGSLEEARYLIRLAADLGYLSADQQQRLSDLDRRVGQLLGGLERSLSSS